MKKFYFNGDFISLENNDFDAILVENNKIKKVGTKEEIMSLKDDNTEVVDLNGKTMMPAFIDPHSHFFNVANNLLSVSLEGCESFKEIEDRLLKYKNENKIESGKWIVAIGYDDNILEEKRHIRKYELDKILPNNPVIIHHKSGHNGVFNSKGLELIGVTNDSEWGYGGKIEKINNETTGFLEENAFIENCKKVPLPKIDELLEACEKAQKKYASYGIATLQDGMFVDELVPIFKRLVDENRLYLDVVAFMDKKAEEEITSAFSDNIKQYNNYFKLGGIKIFLDGSPQEKTAWMRTPYLGEKDYCGYGTMKDEEVFDDVKFAVEKGYQILAHCNGDRAAEQYIDAIAKVGDNAKSIRPVLIHGQLLGVDQLKEVKKLGIIPSFFVAHVYHWGDVHIEHFGFDRAKQISPANSAKKDGVIFTFHQDAPVIEPDMFETIWCAVNRKTMDGVVLGEDEKVTVLDAIKAVTINAAYQYFEENEKGSIKEGKFADLIIVDKNPLKVDVDDIRNIKVLETIKNGKTVYKA